MMTGQLYIKFISFIQIQLCSHKQKLSLVMSKPVFACVVRLWPRLLVVQNPFQSRYFMLWHRPFKVDLMLIHYYPTEDIHLPVDHMCVFVYISFCLPTLIYKKLYTATSQPHTKQATRQPARTNWFQWCMNTTRSYFTHKFEGIWKKLLFFSCASTQKALLCQLNVVDLSGISLDHAHQLTKMLNSRLNRITHCFLVQPDRTATMTHANQSNPFLDTLVSPFDRDDCRNEGSYIGCGYSCNIVCCCSSRRRTKKKQ